MTALSTTPSISTVANRSLKARRMIRRAAFFRRAGLFGGEQTSFVVTRALRLEEFAEAYSLVHDCYVERGYIERNEGGIRVRPFEAMSEMATFVAKAEGKVIAVTSVLMDSPELALPSDKAFEGELAALRAEGRRVCEITNLAVHPDYRNTPVFSELTRCCLAHAMAVGYDDLFIAISPEHARFFQEVLLFEPCGERRSYSTEIEDIVEGKRLDLHSVEDRCIERDDILEHETFLHDFYFAKNEFSKYVRRWAIRAAKTFTDIGLLRELFVVRGDLFSRCNRREAEAIRRRWGADVFDAVVSGDTIAVWTASSGRSADGDGWGHRDSSRDVTSPAHLRAASPSHHLSSTPGGPGHARSTEATAREWADRHRQRHCPAARALAAGAFGAGDIRSGWP